MYDSVTKLCYDYIWSFWLQIISLVFYTHEDTASLVFGRKNHPQFQPFISQIQWLCPDYIDKFLVCCLNEHFVSVVTMVSVINPRMICTGVPVTQAWLQSNGSKCCQVLPVILGEDCLVSQDFGNIWKVKASLQDWTAFRKRVLFLEEEKKAKSWTEGQYCTQRKSHDYGFRPIWEKEKQEAGNSNAGTRSWGANFYIRLATQSLPLGPEKTSFKISSAEVINAFLSSTIFTLET